MDQVIETLKDFFTNYLIVSAIAGWFLAQFAKVFISIFTKEKVNLIALFFSNGGMPSSHSSTVMALCTACVIQEGVSSPLFAICLVLAAVVMIDASGVRYETGKQAQVINKITSELFSGKMDEFNTGLKELVGHTPFQVIVGAILGIIVAVIIGLVL